MDTKDFATRIDLGINFTHDYMAVKHSLDLKPEDYLPAAKAAYSLLAPAENSADFSMQAYLLFGELVHGQNDSHFFAELANHFEQHAVAAAKNGWRLSCHAPDAIRDTMLRGRCPPEMCDRFFELQERTGFLVRSNPPVRGAAPPEPTC